MSEVIRPSIPYYGVIPGGLHDGKRIIIKGKVPYVANIFQVNFTTDYYVSPRCDRPLHVSVRFNEYVVGRNALLDGSYGDEETSGAFPFRFGSKFILEISVNVESYRISVNGCQFWEFSHRTSFRRVSSIYIDDDIQIDRIEYLNGVQSPIDIDDDVQIDSIEFLNRAQSSIDDDVQIDSIKFLNRAQSSIDIDDDVQIDRIEYLGRNRVQPAPGASKRTPSLTSAPEPSKRTSSLTSVRRALTRTPLFTSAPEASTRTSLFTAEASTRTSFVTSAPEASTGTSFFTSVPQASTSTTFFTSPWIFPIHGGLREGMQILIKGSPVRSPQNFTISLQKGSGVFFERDIAFYMDVRFSSSSIVRNSRSNFVWGKEQIMIARFPFLPGVTFSMVITVQLDRFTVDINGDRILSFIHRLNDLSQFNVICIYKDVIITAIEYKFSDL